MSRPPSPSLPRSTHAPLSLRTTVTSTRATPQQRQKAKSSSPSNSTTPKPISSDPIRFRRALKLYTDYYMEKVLAQQSVPQSAVEANRNHLDIPHLPARARSLNSGSSRKYAPSTSTSEFDGTTDLSTVVSFGEESHAGLSNFNGEPVKQRHRRALSPVAKAKAALVRYLKSCDSCSSRRVGCSLDHHDIAALEEAREKKARTRERAQSVQQARSAVSDSSQQDPTVQSAPRQTNDLSGIGQQENLIFTQSAMPALADAQSPAVPDLDIDLSEFHNTSQVLSNAFDLPLMNNDPYAVYQNGDMVPLGVFRDQLYRCTHLNGCGQAFPSSGALEDHCESHFAYNRLAPSHRFVCSNCQSSNELFGSCSACGQSGTIQTWIFGSYIRNPTFFPYGHDGQDLFRNDSAPYAAGMDFMASSMDLTPNGGTGNDSFPTGGDMNEDFFYQNHHNNTTSFEESGSQHGDAGYTTPQSGGYPLQGSWTRQRGKASPVSARYRYGTTLHTSRRCKVVALTLVLLVAFLLFQTREWLLMQARFSPLEYHHLPALGFVGVLVSFVVCYTYLSVKRHGRQSWGARCHPQTWHLHDLPDMTFHHRQPAPNTFVRGGLYS